MRFEDKYYTIAHFCNLKRYRMALYLQKYVEIELRKICLAQDIQFIFIINKLTKQREIAFPHFILEDYFKLWVK